MDLSLLKVGKGQVVRHQKAFRTFRFEEEGFVGEYIGMAEEFDIDETFFEVCDVFDIHFDGFDCTDLVGGFIDTFFDNSMSSFSRFFSHLVPTLKKRLILFFLNNMIIFPMVGLLVANTFLPILFMFNFFFDAIGSNFEDSIIGNIFSKFCHSVVSLVFVVVDIHGGYSFVII